MSVGKHIHWEVLENLRCSRGGLTTVVVEERLVLFGQNKLKEISVFFFVSNFFSFGCVSGEQILVVFEVSWEVLLLLAGCGCISSCN